MSQIPVAGGICCYPCHFSSHILLTDPQLPSKACRHAESPLFSMGELCTLPHSAVSLSHTFFTRSSSPASLLLSSGVVCSHADPPHSSTSFPGFMKDRLVRLWHLGLPGPNNPISTRRMNQLTSRYTSPSTANVKEFATKGIFERRNVIGIICHGEDAHRGFRCAGVPA